MHITITEGRNRQVRKMLEAVGKEVIFLKRIKIGELTLKGLDRGKVRKLTAEEIEYLRNV
jgi:23S rRNA pseudouridine2605 synthase